jgi:hypothetical protein
VLPWPGLNEGYGVFFRVLCRTFLSLDDGKRELYFEKGEAQRAMTITRICIVNTALIKADGTAPVWNLDMDTHGFWNMTALVIALSFATPISRRRKIYGIIWGCLGVHVFILLTVAFSVWNESHYVRLVSLSLFWQGAADKLQDALISQLSLSVPVLIWFVATFRRGDVKIFVADA